jgi:hypothetical protein
MKSRKAKRADRPGWLPASKSDIEKLEHSMATKLTDLAERLNAISSQLDKAKIEIVNAIAALTEALANQEIPAAAQAALDNLASVARDLDELNPDAPPPPG